MVTVAFVAGTVNVHWLPEVELFKLAPVMVKLPVTVCVFPDPKVRVTLEVVQVKSVNVLLPLSVVFAVKVASAKVFSPFTVVPLPENVTSPNVLSPLTVIPAAVKSTSAKVWLPLTVFPAPAKVIVCEAAESPSLAFSLVQFP